MPGGGPVFLLALVVVFKFLSLYRENVGGLSVFRLLVDYLTPLQHLWASVCMPRLLWYMELLVMDGSDTMAHPGLCVMGTNSIQETLC